MKLEDLALFITEHAHEQYCQRVELISRFELHKQVLRQLREEDYRHVGDFLHLDGVWWVVEPKDDCLHLITCYGRTHIDLPAALKWAKLHRDRINLVQ